MKRFLTAALAALCLLSLASCSSPGSPAASGTSSSSVSSSSQQGDTSSSDRPGPTPTVRQIAKERVAAMAARSAGCGDVVLFQPSMRPDGVRKLADAVARSCGGLACVFAGEGETYQYALVRADGAEIKDLVKRLNEALHGRGGGRNGFAQGSVQADQAAIEMFWRDAV